MIYKGIVLSNKFEGGRKEAAIETMFEQILIRIGEEEFVWHTHTIKLELGGSNGQLIYIKQEDSDITVYTRDKSILKDPFLTDDHALKESSGKLRLEVFKYKTLLLSVVFVILAVPLCFFLFRSYIVKQIAKGVPVSWEVEAGDKLFSSVKKQYNIIEDSLISAKFDSLFKPLVEVADYKGIDFKFYLCKDPNLNAFALPGGHIVINSGTIKRIDRIEELYGVLAHELAHVTERHHIRGLIGKLGMFVILQGFLGSEAGIIGTVGESAAELSSLFYSRKFETESDITGYNYLKEANIDPTGMVEFFERINKEHDGIEKDTSAVSLENLSSFLSSHPGTKERIDYLTKKIAKEGKIYTPQKYNVQELKDFINASIN